MLDVEGVKLFVVVDHSGEGKDGFPSELLKNIPVIESLVEKAVE